MVVGVVALNMYLWSQRASELFCLSARAGRVLIVRGRVPPALLGSIRDIVDGAPVVARATIRAVRGNHGARLLCGGAIDEGRAQRLRNVFGVYPMRSSRPPPPSGSRRWASGWGSRGSPWLLDRSRDA